MKYQKIVEKNKNKTCEIDMPGQPMLSESQILSTSTVLPTCHHSGSSGPRAAGL